MPLTTASSSSDKTVLVEGSIAYHSGWMRREPDKFIKRHTAYRRERFPVAVMVVVHEDFSLMRVALEEVAIVVEHIVSGKSAVHVVVLVGIFFSVDDPCSRSKTIISFGGGHQLMATLPF